MKTRVQNLAQPAFLTSKKSTLPGAGKGLFTRRRIAAGSLIIEYTGLITTLKEIERGNEVNPYVYFISRNHVINALHFPESLGRYANDAEGLVTLAGVTNNARFFVVKKQVFLRATADILPGSEIFAPYGKDYWESLAFNLAVEKSYGSLPVKIKKKR